MPSLDKLRHEEERVLSVYQKRMEKLAKETFFFTYRYPVYLLLMQEKERVILHLLAKYGFNPLAEAQVLDVGCGNGGLLQMMISAGAKPSRLYGVDLRHLPLVDAIQRYPGVNYICTNAAVLPFADGAFDIVSQCTLFSSVLDLSVRQVIAREMYRCLRPGGIILYYDFIYDNPANPDVRGIKKAEIRSLFPHCNMETKRITLAPPLARRLSGRLAPLVYPWLTFLRFLCTHYLTVLRKV